jgi:fatty acid desaturase
VQEPTTKPAIEQNKWRNLGQVVVMIYRKSWRKTKIFISNEKGLYQGGRMDLITVIEDLQALLVLVIFLLIIAVGFKIWAWNYSVPHK